MLRQPPEFGEDENEPETEDDTLAEDDEGTIGAGREFVSDDIPDDGEDDKPVQDGRWRTSAWKAQERASERRADELLGGQYTEGKLRTLKDRHKYESAAAGVGSDIYDDYSSVTDAGEQGAPAFHVDKKDLPRIHVETPERMARWLVERLEEDLRDWAASADWMPCLLGLIALPEDDLRALCLIARHGRAADALLARLTVLKGDLHPAVDTYFRHAFLTTPKDPDSNGVMSRRPVRGTPGFAKRRLAEMAGMSKTTFDRRTQAVLKAAQQLLADDSTARRILWFARHGAAHRWAVWDWMDEHLPIEHAAPEAGADRVRSAGDGKRRDKVPYYMTKACQAHVAKRKRIELQVKGPRGLLEVDEVAKAYRSIQEAIAWLDRLCDMLKQDERALYKGKGLELRDTIGSAIDSALDMMWDVEDDLRAVVPSTEMEQMRAVAKRLADLHDRRSALGDVKDALVHGLDFFEAIRHEAARAARIAAEQMEGADHRC